MGYRDESDALRARVASLESQLDETRRKQPAQTKPSVLPSGNFFEKRVLRHAASIDGRVSRAGLDGIAQALWAKLGAANSKKSGDANGSEAPGESLLVHKRGFRVARVTESGGKTHLSLDHRKWGAGQISVAVVLTAVALTLGMMGVGVHDDWTQLLMAIYASAVVLLGPIAILMSWVREARSAELFKSITRLIAEDIQNQPVPLQARISADVARGHGDDNEAAPNESAAQANPPLGVQTRSGSR